MGDNMTEGLKNSILIVDDERSNIAALTFILSPLYTVYAAKSGAEALEAVNEFKPDVILLDIIMMDMDGYAVLAEIKKDARTRHIPVIILSGLRSREDEEKGFALQAADYIEKPYSEAILKMRVANQMLIVNLRRELEKSEGVR